MSGPPDLVLAGNLLVDDIVLADGTTLLGEPGGAVLHAAPLAASTTTRSPFRLNPAPKPASSFFW